MPRTEAGHGYHIDSDSSQDGAIQVESTAKSLHKQILHCIEESGSITGDEFAILSGRDRSVASPRFKELEKMGLIEKRTDPDKPGKFLRRRSSSGVLVWIYWLKPKEPVQLKLVFTNKSHI
jgi:predicted transcriptional regulator